MSEGTLLFVDDEANILKALKRVFIPEGYEVHTAEGGKEGLEILEETAIDVIISDMRMPEMDGAAFLSEAVKNWPLVKRVLLTGYADMDSTIKAVNDGKIDQYISKPWDEEEILMVVRQMMEAKKLKEENVSLNSALEEKNQELEGLNAALETKVKERTAELGDAYTQLKGQYKSVVKSFSTIIDVCTTKNKGHVKRVAKNAKLLANALEFDEKDEQRLIIASLLSDIGKLGLPEELRYKPEHLLSSQEEVEYRKYPAMAEAFLGHLSLFDDIRPAIVQYQESLDGKGFPSGLKADDIDEHAKILRIVKDYDSLQIGMIINRPLSAKEAWEKIEHRAGTVYDEQYVKAFAAVLQKEAGGVQNKDTEKSHGKNIPVHAVQEGMVLADDVCTPTGLTLIPEGEKVSDALIEKMLQFGVTEVTIVTKA